MVNTVYRASYGDHSLGGLVNGEIDGLIVITTGETNIFDIYFEDKSNIALSNKYSLVLNHLTSETMPVNYLEKDMDIFRIDGSSVKIMDIKTRRGKEIIIPKRLINLNGFLVVFHGG